MGLYKWLALGLNFSWPVWLVGTRLPAHSSLFHRCCSSPAVLLTQPRDCSLEPYTVPGRLRHLIVRPATGGRSLEDLGARPLGACPSPSLEAPALGASGELDLGPYSQ